MKINWKGAASAPRDKPVLVCNVDLQDQAIAKFCRISHTDVVYGWVWAVECRQSRDRVALLSWEPTHWTDAPAIPPKPKAKCPKGCKPE